MGYEGVDCILDMLFFAGSSVAEAEFGALGLKCQFSYIYFASAPVTVFVQGTLQLRAPLVSSYTWHLTSSLPQFVFQLGIY
jgi:hypothetical protein